MRITTPYEGVPARRWQPGAGHRAPLRLHTATVVEDWADYNGHLSESAYLLIVGDGADAFFRYVGIDETYRDAGHSLFTAETHLHHLAEGRVGQVLHVDLRVLDVDTKRVHVFHEVRDAEDDHLVATAEQLLLHVDTRSGRVAPMATDLLARLVDVRDAHAVLDRPDAVGHVMGIRR